MLWLVGLNLALLALDRALPVPPPGGEPVRPGLLVASLALDSLSLAAAALLAAGRPRPTRLRLGPGRLPAPAVATAVVGLLAIGQLFDAGLGWLGLRDAGTLGLLDRSVARMSAPLLALMVLAGGALAGAGEELFFRGYLQTRLAAAWGAGRAIAVTAVAFGFLHADPVHGAFALVVGLYLGWVTELAGSVRPAMVAHVVNNVASLLQSVCCPGATGGVALLPLYAGLAVAAGMRLARHRRLAV